MQDAPPILNYVSRADDALTSRKRRVIRFGVESLLTGMGAVLLLAGFVGMFLLFNLSVVSGLIGAVVGCLLIPLIGRFVRRRQRVASLRALQYVEQAVRLSLPFPEFLRLAAQNESGKPAAQLRTLADSVSQGVALGDAMRNDLVELPPRVAWLVRSAEANGTLGPTLSRLSAQVNESNDESQGPMFARNYVVMLVAMFILVVIVILIFVAPKFVQIARDFGISSLPLVNAMRWLDSPTVQITAVLVFLAAVLLAFGSVVSAASALMGRRERHFPGVQRIADIVAWHLPVIGSVRRDQQLADTCHLLGDALRAHRPFDAALIEAGQPHLSHVLLRRIERWYLAHSAGRTIGGSARAAGMPALFTGLLPDSADAASCAAAFDFLARHYDARARRLRQWLRAIVPTLVTFAFGAVTLFISHLLYSSIARLIDSTNPYKVGL